MNKDLIIKRLTEKQMETYNAICKRLERQETVTSQQISRDIGVKDSAIRARLDTLIRNKLVVLACKKYTFKYTLS